MYNHFKQRLRFHNFLNLEFFQKIDAFHMLIFLVLKIKQVLKRNRTTKSQRFFEGIKSVTILYCQGIIHYASLCYQDHVRHTYVFQRYERAREEKMCFIQ